MAEIKKGAPNTVYLSLNCPIYDTNDLEAATKTVTATAEGAALVNADYSAALTVVAPTDSRLAINMIGARLQVTIDSMTAANVYCRVYVDVKDTDHLLFDENWTTTGAKIDGVNTHSTNKAVIFNLLKDGAAHTFYVFFWVNAGNAVVSLVELQEAIGYYGTTATKAQLTLTHYGQAQLSGFVGTKAGSGALTGHFVTVPDTGPLSGTEYDISPPNFNHVICAGTHGFSVDSTVATDLSTFRNFFVILEVP